MATLSRAPSLGVHPRTRRRRRHDRDIQPVPTADGRTQVDLDNDGFTETDQAPATCNTLWDILLGHLKNYAETAVTSPAFE